MEELKDHEVKLLELMAELEGKMALLYCELAKTVPGFSGLWNRLEREELQHRKWVLQLKEAAEAGKVTFAEGRIRTYTVKTFLQYLEVQVERARKGSFTPEKALACARDLENSLLEKETFSHFSCEKPEHAKILKALSEACENHGSLIGEALKEVVWID